MTRLLGNWGRYTIKGRVSREVTGKKERKSELFVVEETGREKDGGSLMFLKTLIHSMAIIPLLCVLITFNGFEIRTSENILLFQFLLCVAVSLSNKQTQPASNWVYTL